MKSILTMISLFVLVNTSFGQEIQNEAQINQAQNLSTAIVAIEGMACQEGCADKISSNLQLTDGVISALVSYKEKEAIIRYDAETITPEKLKSIITDTKVKEYVYTIKDITIEN